jgi:hypothetical protein
MCSQRIQSGTKNWGDFPNESAFRVPISVLEMMAQAGCAVREEE